MTLELVSLSEHYEARDKWFLVKPRSGANDVFCQVERSLRFAEMHDRNLVIDSDDSGLMVPFAQIFGLVKAGVPVYCVSQNPEIYRLLNAKESFPSEISGRLDDYRNLNYYLGPVEEGVPAINGTGSWKSKKKNLEAQVLVHESGGGGVASTCLLRRSQFSLELVDFLAARLKALPSEYLGVHIRHTDVFTDFRPVFDRVSTLSDDQPVFVATDSAYVMEEAKKFFGADRVLNSAISYDAKAEQLHQNFSKLDYKSRRARSFTTLFELVALARSSHFVYGSLNSGSGISGFSRLALFLFRNPNVAAHLMGSRVDQFVTRPKRLDYHVAGLRSRTFEKIRWLRESNCLKRYS